MSRPTTIVVAAEPGTALLASAAALRRLGAKITRYETDDGTLEARLGAESLRLTATPSRNETSELHIETDAKRGRALVRRLRAELARR